MRFKRYDRAMGYLLKNVFVTAIADALALIFLDLFCRRNALIDILVAQFSHVWGVVGFITHISKSLLFYFGSLLKV